MGSATKDAMGVSERDDRRHVPAHHHGDQRRRASTVPFSVDPRTGTLVKNTDRVGLPSGIDENVLFVFRTGLNSAGYGLSRIGLKMASGSVTSPGPVKITTRGRGHSEGSTVTTLEAPALLVASRVNYFTVPAEVTLSVDTEYLVSLGNATSVLMTNPGYVDRGRADGWELLRRLRPVVRSGVDQRIPQVEIGGSSCRTLRGPARRGCHRRSRAMPELGVAVRRCGSRRGRGSRKGLTGSTTRYLSSRHSHRRTQRTRTLNSGVRLHELNAVAEGVVDVDAVVALERVVVANGSACGSELFNERWETIHQ